MSTERQIDRLDRQTNSASGNPRYRVHFTDGGNALTADDAACSYWITNPEFRDVPVLVEMDRSGKITNVRPAGSLVAPGPGPRGTNDYRPRCNECDAPLVPAHGVPAWASGRWADENGSVRCGLRSHKPVESVTR